MSEEIRVRGGPSQLVLRQGRGTPLVWLHGIERVRADDPVMAALGREFEVLAPLAPGYRDLNELDDLNDVHDLALHYDGLLESLGLDQVTLVGHSFGAMIAAELAAHVPKRVARLVLVAPIGLWNDRYPPADLAARPVPEIDQLLWSGATARPKPPDSATQTEDRIEQLVQLSNGFATVAKFTWPIPDKGLRRRLPRIQARTRLVFGRDDAFIPAAYADDFAQGIAQATSTVEPGSHMLPYEDPDRFAGLVRAFLD